MKNKISVLIVDDEKGMRDLFVVALAPLGVQVLAAKNGSDALRMVKKNLYDIIFLDVYMPKMNGIEALKAIRAIRPAQIVVMLSGCLNAGLGSGNDLKKLGAYKCIYKPFEINEILKIVKAVIHRGGVDRSV